MTDTKIIITLKDIDKELTIDIIHAVDKMILNNWLDSKQYEVSIYE